MRTKHNCPCFVHRRSGADGCPSGSPSEVTREIRKREPVTPSDNEIDQHEQRTVDASGGGTRSPTFARSVVIGHGIRSRTSRRPRIRHFRCTCTDRTL